MIQYLYIWDTALVKRNMFILLLPSSYPSFLIATVMFIFSIFAASANCERGFSKMSYMISSRRAGITADNADKSLMISNYKIPGFLLVSLGGLFLSSGGALFKLFENQDE